MTDKKINVLRGRKLSLEGAKPIGVGACGKVYLLPDDNVVKVLFSTDYAEAEREISLSKWAFLKGIATAISYDVVEVDGHPGLVYESLGRDNLRNHLRDNPDQRTSLLEQYLAFIKSIGAIEVEPGQLPSAKQNFLNKIAPIRAYFEPAAFERILSLIDTVPESLHMVHGDCHMKNIKVVEDKFYLIDLDTLSAGDPIFELSGIACAYHAYAQLNLDENGFNTFFEIDNSIIQEAYRFITDRYFESINEEDKRENRTKTELLTYILMLDYLDPDNEKEKPLFDEFLHQVNEKIYTVKDLVLKR